MSVLEQAEVPVDVRRLRTAAKRPAQAGLEGARDHLLERRIADEEIGQAAGRLAGSAQESSAGVGARLASA